MTENLNEALKEQISISESNIKDLESEVDKAKRAGLDVRALESELNTQKSQIKLIKDVYGL